ncbi:MAG: hypothetical protein GY832_12200 [Chloroflexi bacterium]|nr:hypothetical protein [Chloroflexota bacterium]
MRALPANIQKRGLNRAEAAEYCDLSPNAFDTAVDEGEIPRPVHFGRIGRNVWDRKALDLLFDRKSGLVADNDDNLMGTIDAIKT